jgi:NodT family efflux transporter outer membrane factor (OMF) lipoprotein
MNLILSSTSGAKRRKLSCLLSSLCLLASGCASNPSATEEAAIPALPDQWRRESVALAGDDLPSAGLPSAGFSNSETLNRLLAEAETASLDVAVAAARVRQAEAVAKIAGASLLPEITAGLNARRSGDFDKDASTRNYGASFAARFELDFWGQNRARRDAAFHHVAAAQFERDTVRVTLIASVANVWFLQVALRERIGIAELNLENAERLLALVESRARAGAASALELAQQRGFVASQRRTLARLRQEAEAARTALSLLLARPEGVESGIELGAETLADLQVPVMDVGIPSALLARRPDIAQAEARLAAANANVKAARAALFPTVTLGAEIGASGERLRYAFDHPAYSLLAGLTAPIFNAGRLSAARDLAAAEREELLADYRRSILAAFADVEYALAEADSLATQSRLHAEELAEAERALALSESRYRAGAETLLNLLEAQRAFYAARDEAAWLKLQQLTAAVALYKSCPARPADGNFFGRPIPDSALLTKRMP